MLYQFEIMLSDVDREVYETLEFRLSQHPSESNSYLLTRALAYSLSYQSGLEFSLAGLAEPEFPALQVRAAMGGYELWIEIGNPSPKKLHKATKVSQRVEIYTYKNPELIVKEVASENVHRAEQIQIFAFDPKFLERLEVTMMKRNRWSLLHQEGHVDLGVGEIALATDLRKMLASPSKKPPTP